MSIRLKLTVIFLVIALIPLVLVSSLAFHNYRKSVENIQLSALSNVAAFKADKIETYFDGLKDDITIAQSLYNIRTNLPILTKFENNMKDPTAVSAKNMLDKQLQPTQTVLDISDIMLTTPKGKIVYVSNPMHYSKDLLKPLQDSEKKAFKEGLTKTYISDIFRDKALGDRPAIMITAPAFDLKNNFIGVIAFEIDMAPIYQLIQDAKGLGVTGETLVGKKTGNQFIFLNPLKHEGDSFLKKQMSIGANLAEPMQNAVMGKTGSGQLIDYRGKRVIAAWRNLPSLNWGMVVKIDVDEAFGEIRNLRNLVVVIVIVIFIFIAIIAFSIAQSISDPIKKLSKGAEMIGKGNLDYKVGLPLKDEIGQLSRAFDNMTRDLKEVTASRDELRKTEEGLKRSNENLEQFAYVASHDLQEPLRIMASYSELLEKRYKDKLDTDANEFINYIVDAAKRMQKLINDLLAFSRIGRENRQITDIDGEMLLEKVIASMAPIITDNKAIITHDKLPTFTGYESSFIQLFQNLIGNAIKFHGQQTPRIHIGAVKRNEQWLISVKDNGIGIEPQYKERIFLIFQRLHGREEYPGTGIGLAICKKIVETHGGKIWLESEYGKGTTFYFTIPIKMEEKENGEWKISTTT
ncbi:MAG: ATP-binding protein [bacterium]